MDAAGPVGADVWGDAWTNAMRTHDFARAWQIADDVLAARDPATRDDPRLPYHQRWVWDGTPPDGRHVVVRCYHGLGDTLQFCRFLPALRRRALQVTLEVQPELLALVREMESVDRCVAFDPGNPIAPGDCDVEIMELGHMLRASPQDAGACVPYLKCRSQAGMQAAIALCWQAGDWDRGRSVPLPDLLAACTAPGRRFVSLQRGPASTQADDERFLNPGDADPDIGRTASLACGARLVVTVDTMVAHLAGALARPTVLLLKHESDWRWPVAGRRSAWYPTMTVLRQSVPGHWTEPLRELAALVNP